MTTLANEPFYIAQCRKVKSCDERDQWFKDQIKLAQEKGAAWCRCSFHYMDDNRVIIEAWKERPRREGAVRWQVASRDEAELEKTIVTTGGRVGPPDAL